VAARRGERPRAERPEGVEVTAADVVDEELPQFGMAAGPRAVEIEVERPAGQDRDAREEIGMREAQPGRTVAPHAEALENPTLAAGHRAKLAIDLGDQVADEHRLHGGRAVLRVGPQAARQAVDEHDE